MSGRSDSEPTRLHCTIVFVETAPGRVRLDCVAIGTRAGAGLFLEDGEPFVIETAMPNAGWAPAALAALERWSAEQRDIEIVLEHDGDSLRVRASDGRTRMLLDG